jgi:hypothetical protein
MTEIYINWKQHLLSSITDEWGRDWEEEYHFSVNNAYLSGEHMAVESFKTIHDVNVGDTVYVLVIRYSDGNSFGRAYGKGEVLWVFTSKEIAEKASDTFTKAIEEKDYDKPYTIEIELEDGSKVSIGNPVYDYFTTLDECEIIELKVEE